MHMKILPYLYLLILVSACGAKAEPNPKESDQMQDRSEVVNVPDTIKYDIIADRDSSFKRLQLKIANKEALIVHALTPLCDNIHQGIVPVAKHLGNGRDLKGNLYWGCGHGMKAYFKNRHGWKHVQSDSLDGEIILERSVFKKTMPNGCVVFLVSDAFAGEKMKECLDYFWNYTAANNPQIIVVGADTLAIGGGADLIVFNGHNGLMDGYELPEHTNTVSYKEAVSISCFSHNYFSYAYQRIGAYPLVHTTGLLYPGAFIVDAIIGKWAMGKHEADMRVAAGEAYNREMNCGRSAGINLFKAGW